MVVKISYTIGHSIRSSTEFVVFQRDHGVRQVAKGGITYPQDDATTSEN